MPHIEKTAFEPKNTNGVYNGLGNVAGLFRSPSGAVKIPEECPAGYLCVQDALMPLDGYDASNGNTWYFKPCEEAKVDGLPADRTGIYAANTYRVESVEDGDSQYNLGLNTLGIPIPELERGTFTELMLGEVYKFGEGNFATPPNEGDYVPIVGPIFGAGDSTPPDDDGAVWGEVLRIEPFNDGPRYYGNGYCVKIFRNGQEGSTPPTPPTPPTPGDETNFIHFLEGSSTSIPIPDGTTTLRAFSFYRVPFTSVTIPDTVEAIGQSTFRSATQLTSLTIPDSVLSVGANAFDACSRLETLVWEGPAAETVSVGSSTFAGCSSLKNVTLSSSLTDISENMFAQCTALEEITIPEGVVTIRSYAFNLCRNLKRVSIPSTVTTILANAFQSNFLLESVNLPAGLTGMGTGVFNGCTALTSLVLPAGISSVSQALCQNCSAMTSVTIPEGPTSIGAFAFARTQLSNVVIPSTITTIGMNAFVDVPGPLLCRFSEGAVTGAPWGCTGEIIYDYNG